MEKAIREFFSGIKVGARQSHKNMTLFCLLAAREVDVDFITLDEALLTDWLGITEVTEEGSVRELKVINRSDKKILLLDGEELVGAKQNRVLNVTILIGPRSETVVPVSCVEEGRWNYRTPKFGSESRALNAALRKSKAAFVRSNLVAGEGFASNQAEIWNEIEAKHARMSVPQSPTRAMADLYEAVKDSAGDYLKALHPVENQVGMAAFIDGKPAGVELLGKFDAFRRNHSKLVNSYVMDALETAGSTVKTDREPSKARVSRILQSAAGASMEKRKSVAHGSDIRLESDFIIAAGLEYDGQILQMSVFYKNSNLHGQLRASTVRRASQRRCNVSR
ncbi:MAG: ARPP-1 family domain-containing protein [Desulfomonilaceae bacterium]